MSTTVQTVRTEAPVRHTNHLIGGSWEAGSGTPRQILDPGTGQVVAEVAWGAAAEAARAIDAAVAAQPGWAGLTAFERGTVLADAARAIRDDLESLARIMTLETGKPLREAKAEWTSSADILEWFAEEGKRAYGRVIPARKAGRRILVLVQPAGVVGTITAWNFPAYLPARKWAAALAAGCAVVGRPSSQTPLSGLALAGVLKRVGLPDGVLNVVVGPAAQIADTMLGDERLRVIGFTGSEDAGRYLLDRAGQTMTRLRLELGGSAPVLVLDDADVDQAARQSIQAKFRNAGQVCISPSRFLVHEAVLDAFLDRVGALAEQLVVGHGLEPSTDVGPVIDEVALERISRLVDEAVKDGARLIHGGKRLTGPGFFFEPTIVAGVQPSMRLAMDEIFGPVMPVISFASLDEAIALANNTRYGLAAYVHTRDLSTALHLAEALESGIVGINDMVPATAEAPFGGWKASGNASEGGIEGIREYLETKYVAIGG